MLNFRRLHVADKTADCVCVTISRQCQLVSHTDSSQISTPRFLAMMSLFAHSLIPFE
ncbi:hypothetical protein KIN20_004172 [Parelaphostrongylus tenuis]|uniref:Uncharacterized protein n=1 Tax=Parelaphostrongylus tenuis TaxID=148309 RepID=A0AAD5LYD9_PARTN|nr:hypothetical protein KIN20_004172 [Parelaphostrongylus tenuis]